MDFLCKLDIWEATAVIAVISAIIWNLVTPKYGLAYLGAWISTVAGIQISNSFCVGYIDPFWPIAIVVSFVPTLLIVTIANLPFIMFRYRNEQLKNQKRKEN